MRRMSGTPKGHLPQSALMGCTSQPIRIALIRRSAKRRQLLPLLSVDPEVRSHPTPIAKFPFDTQVVRAKNRIKYLADEYFQTDRMSLAEVIGQYGDNVLDSVNLYDWPKVLEELERQGLIQILERPQGNIVFRVVRSAKSWGGS